MCVQPTILPSIGPVGCRLCWQCRANRINDYVGRCIAEQKHSSGALAVSLTYGGGDDNTHAAVLVYKDFQDFMKALRRTGERAPQGKKFTVRYIVAGEYGSKKGRSHWHAVLFFQGHVPEVKLETDQYTWKHWKHGYSYFQKPDYGGFHYIMKYALKDTNQETSDSHLGRSMQPPLGDAFFADLAKRYVDQNISPKDYFYSFGDCFDNKRKRRIFMMQGVSRENFVDYYLHDYAQRKGGEHPLSEMIIEQMDRRYEPEPMTDEKLMRIFDTDATGTTYQEKQSVPVNYWSCTYDGLRCGVMALIGPEFLNVRYLNKKGDEQTWLVTEKQTVEKFKNQARDIRSLTRRQYLDLPL